MIETIRQGLKEDRFDVSIRKLCKWLEASRPTVYYGSNKAVPRVQERPLIPIRATIEENPPFGYRTVAHLLELNENTAQRIFQLKGCQVRKRPVGFRPRIQDLLSAGRLNDRWATDLCRTWAPHDGWTMLALVMDCCGRELLGGHLSRSGRSKTAGSGLEQVLVARFERAGRGAAVIWLLSAKTCFRYSSTATRRVGNVGRPAIDTNYSELLQSAAP